MIKMHHTYKLKNDKQITIDAYEPYTDEQYNRYYGMINYKEFQYDKFGDCKTNPDYSIDWASKVIDDLAEVYDEKHKVPKMQKPKDKNTYHWPHAFILFWLLLLFYR